MNTKDIMGYGNIGILIIAILAIAVSGLFFGFSYFLMDNVQTALEGANCVIPNNGIVSNCQELFELAAYPFLRMKDILIWASFFFIFILAISLLVLGYQSGFKPIMLGLLVVVEVFITYGSLYISNIYYILVSNPVINSMMTPFTVYNKIMLNFPWFVFIISLFSLTMGVVNWQRTRINSSNSDLNY